MHHDRVSFNSERKASPISSSPTGTAMTNKQDFTPEEWTTLLQSTMVAGVAVSASDPSGLLGTLLEFVANSAALDASKLDPNANALVKAVVADFQSPMAKSDIGKALHKRFADATDSADCVGRSLGCLREVSAILDNKAPDDATGFKAWLCDISRNVAEAAVEGGFLGLGGVRVSKAEAATLGDIANALDLPA
jgi:hypothetical protein